MILLFSVNLMNQPPLIQLRDPSYQWYGTRRNNSSLHMPLLCQPNLIYFVSQSGTRD